MLKSILFFNESLDGGGAECVLANLLKFIDKNKYDITMISETDNELNTPVVISNSRHKCFATKNVSNNFLKEIYNRAVFWFSAHAPLSLVYRVFIREKYDIEIAFCEGYSTKLISKSNNKKSKKVAWIHTDFINNPWSEKMFKNAEDEKKAYEKFDAINCVSETAKNSFIEKYGMAEKVNVVYNPVDKKNIILKSQLPLTLEKFDGLTFIAIGRLVEVKGYKRLINIFKKLHDENYKIRLLILGKGEKYDELSQQISALDADTYIKLMGFRTNPYNYMAAADAFICSSYAEGFSSVVTEALVLGLPVITTKCSGMEEIFGDESCGIICENNEDELLASLKKVLDCPALLLRYKQGALNRSEAFDIDNQIKMIEKIFDNLLQ